MVTIPTGTKVIDMQRLTPMCRIQCSSSSNSSSYSSSNSLSAAMKKPIKSSAAIFFRTVHTLVLSPQPMPVLRTASQQHWVSKLQLASEAPHLFKSLNRLRDPRTMLVVECVRSMSVLVGQTSSAKRTARGGPSQPEDCTEQNLAFNLTISAGVGAGLHDGARH